MQRSTRSALTVDCGLNLFGDASHEIAEGLSGALPVEGLTGSVVQQVSSGTQCLLVVH